jgi:hypothetical protein
MSLSWLGKSGISLNLIPTSTTTRTSTSCGKEFHAVISKKLRGWVWISSDYSLTIPSTHQYLFQ